MTQAISTYLNEHLGVFLRDKNLNDDTVGAVSNEVEHRLTSLLAHWSDAEFRSTLLLVAAEEAAFYMPLHPDVNALVVLSIRNSQRLQDLHHSEGVLNDSEIRELTSQAIDYFAGVDLAELAGQVEAGEDLFGALPTQYPLAWEALGQIALGTGKYPSKTFDPLSGALTDLPSPEQVVDGELLEDLTQIRDTEKGFLFRDSFKMLSRDTDKLFYVIEYVLRAGKTLITHNYYISNGMVARRKQLLKPAQKTTDIYKKFDNKTGLMNRHKDSLRLLKKFIVPSERPAAAPEEALEETPAE